MENELPIVHALWIGDSLGIISSSCLKSFVMRGHSVYLHTYGNITDLPEGVTVQDANLIIPQDKIIKHRKTGSYALFSDLFRYELLKHLNGKGIYIDCDVYCLKPLSLTGTGYVLGFEDDSYVNGAVLALPPDSDILNLLMKAAYDPLFIPPWFSKKQQKRLKIKKMLGIGRKLEDMPWGVIGPRAITYYVKELGIEELVQKADVYYPVHYTKVKGYLMDPDLRLDDLITSRTRVFHLYNEMLRKVDLKKVPKGSVLYKMLHNEI